MGHLLKKLFFLLGCAALLLWVLTEREAHENKKTFETGLRFYDDPAHLATVRVDDALLLQLIERSRHDNTEKGYPLPENVQQNFLFDPLKRLLEPGSPVPNLIFYRRSDPYQALPAIQNNSYLLNAPYDRYLRDPYDDILFKALYCDITGYDDADFAILRSLRSGKGDYADTHFLLGLLLLRENNCFPRDRLTAEIQAVVKNMAIAEQQDTVFSDLYVERIVFLYWAGAGDMVKKEWIKTVRENLTDDPGWRDSGTAVSNPHTTGLALLSLLYFIEGEAAQSFYVHPDTKTRSPDRIPSERLSVPPFFTGSFVSPPHER